MQGKQFIPSRQGHLEAVVSLGTPNSAYLMIINHPHPAFGGTMDNKVVITVEGVAKALGMASIRFNFRGVGGSSGELHDGGQDFHNELADLDIIYEWAKLNLNFSHLWLTGFSFGSFIAANRANRYGCQHLTLIAPPLERFPFPDDFNASVTVIQGEEDEIVDTSQVFHWCDRHQFKLLRLSASHFFHGALIELKEQLQVSWKAML